MTRMTPALARVLVEERERETQRRRRRRESEEQAQQKAAEKAGGKTVSTVRVPQQRSGVRLPPR